MRRIKVCCLVLAGAVLGACSNRDARAGSSDGSSEDDLDARLGAMLAERGFTGRIQETLEARLGRPVDLRLADLGRLLFFDPVLSLTRDNSCSGCHGPNVSFNDSRPIAIGIGNNGVVGPGRDGPHNLRRAPTLINAAFYPKLMWDGRFSAGSLDPFDNARGFVFPEPEGSSLSALEHLLVAQAYTPVVAREEMAGFGFAGDHEHMRRVLVERVSAIAEYRTRFGATFPRVGSGEPITFAHIAGALAEFQFTLVRADAPIDAFARGDVGALTTAQKRGGILFLGRAMCGECHIVGLYANEMFSDFDTHVLGVPQVAPTSTNVSFDGGDRNEDFGRERVTGDPEDRYEFRTSPLRNVAHQPSFMHNGAYDCLDDAIRHHLEAREMLPAYGGERLGATLQGRRGPVGPLLTRLHTLLQEPPDLSETDLRHLIDFVQHALTDPDAHPVRLRALVPESVPSGLPVHDFQFGAPRPECG